MNSHQEREAKIANKLLPLTRDIASVVTLGIILLCVHELASPFERGFQCDDDTIRYPHKESTISSAVCYFFGSGLNIFLILLLEYQLLRNEISNSNLRGVNDEFQIRLYVRNVYCRLIIWLFGAISSELLTDISKFTAGRLRPHFIDVCNPMIGGMTLDEYCQTSAVKYKYITNYHCTGPLYPRLHKDIRLSFMSGHSSYSAYSAAFAVFYLQSAMDVTKLGLIKPALQVLIISAAFYTGLTRVSDYKHHWQDVLAGLLQGTSVATLVSLYLWPPFHKTYTRYFKNACPRAGDDQTGEELNRVGY